MKRFKKILVSMLIFSLFIPNLTFATETNTKANLSQLRMTDKGIEIALDGFTDSSYENGYYSYVIYDDNGGRNFLTYRTFTTINVIGDEISIKIKDPKGNVLGEYIYLNHNHKYKEINLSPTCKQNGKIISTCTQGCDSIQTEIVDKSAHAYKLTKTVNSTCSKTGTKTYTCGLCKDIKTTTITKKAHTYKYVKTVKSSCTVKGHKLYKCQKCTATKKTNIQDVKHSYKLVKTVKAVDGKDGYKSYKCTKCKKTKKTILSTGYVGTINCKSLGLKVKVYDTTKTSPKASSQTICDRKNSAAYIKLYKQHVIADHNYQGFSKINNAKVNKTTLTFNGKTYKCYKSFKGHNTGTTLTTWDGKSLTEANPGGLTLYTCLDNWQNVRITYWKLVK